MGAEQLNHPIEQFLHGYADGHRLLAGSTRLGSKDARQLLIHSDVAATKDRHLSSLPLPDAGYWTLTATWSAPEMPRPGSVWSHTLAIRLDDMGELRTAVPLLAAFRRPDGQHDVDTYRRSLLLDEGEVTQRRPTIARDLAEAVALSLYGWPGEPTAVVHPELAALEQTYLAFWVQQWGALRSQASFATRARIGSPSAARVQLVQARGGGAERSVQVLEPANLPKRPPWVGLLVEDLSEPNGLGTFLETYGPDSRAGFQEVPLLVRLHSELQQDGRELDPIRQLCARYSKKMQMERLKLDCLSEDGHAWPSADEEMKLRAVLEFHASVRWRRLDVPHRIAALRERNLADFVELLGRAWSSSDTSLSQSVLKVVAEAEIDGVTLARLVNADPALAARVGARAPAVIASPEVWRNPNDQSVSFLEKLAWDPVPNLKPALTKTLLGLGSERVLAAATRLDLVDVPTMARFMVEESSDAEASAYLRSLSKKDTRTVVESAIAEEDWQSVARLLFLTDKWRPTSSDAVVDLLVPHLDGLDLSTRRRCAVKLLAFARGDRRGVVLQAAFATLHKSLVDEELDDDWATLEGILPEGNDWDRAERLRMLLADEIDEQHWNSKRICSTITGSGKHAAQLPKLLPKGESRKAAERAVKDADLKGKVPA